MLAYFIFALYTPVLYIFIFFIQLVVRIPLYLNQKEIVNH